MDEIDYLRSKIFLTPNEATCIKRNLILEKYLTCEKKNLNNKCRQNTRQINQSIENIEKTQKKINRSTGIAFKNLENENKSKEKSETTSNYNIRLPTGAQSAMECRTTRENCFQHDLVQRSKSMLEYSGSRYMTKYNLDSYNDTVYKDSVKKFIDSSKKVAYTHKLNEEVKGKVLKEKKPKKSGISSSYVTFKEKDLVEWNKYAQIRVPKKIADEREQDEKFEFKDKEKYKIYLELCEVRDSLVKIPQSKIERNKKLDPVFTKRYKQFVFAKSCNRAPEFDQGDTIIKPFCHKYLIKKQMEKIINDNSVNKEKNHFFQEEFLKNVEKVKQFSQQFEIF